MGGMLAIRQRSFGPADVLRIEEVPDPEPRAGQLRIAVEAAGVHVLDTSIRAGESFGMMRRPELPMVPGREVAGVVDAVGPGVGPDWVGRRVVAHLGMTSGGYAERAVVAADRVHEIPEGVDAATAVAAIGTGRTAAGILELAALGPDDVVAVTSAAGGLGVLLLQGARHAGANPVGLAGGAEKLRVARRFGAATAVDYRAAGWAEHVPAPTVVLDGVGGEVGRTLYRMLVPGGRLVRFGWSPGEENDYADPDRRVIELQGPAIAARIAELEEDALAAAADGSRVPYVGTALPLAEAAAAHRALEQRTSIGKVVLLPGRMTP
jgi:NADPH2:quinone reductase